MSSGQVNGRPASVGDPGLQPERTDLAWRRTQLSVVVAALAVSRHALGGGALLQTAGALAVAGLVILLLLVQRSVAVTSLAVLVVATTQLVATTWS